MFTSLRRAFSLPQHSPQSIPGGYGRQKNRLEKLGGGLKHELLVYFYEQTVAIPMGCHLQN